MAMLKLACALLFAMVVVAPLAEAGITCGTVSKNIVPCMKYLTTNVALPKACCDGVSALSKAAATSADRRTACTCLKSMSGAISGLNRGKAAALPGKCGVRVPYAISPSTDCSKVN
ncbi:hypothetical protein Droror1_Dr00013770 [Drosera rotundifolia]